MACMLSVNDEIVAIVGGTRTLTTLHFDALDRRTQALVCALCAVLLDDRRTSTVHIERRAAAWPKARTD